MSQLGFIGVSASPQVLWPPNGRVVPTVVTVSGSESGNPLPGNTTLVYSVTDSEGPLTSGARVVPSSQVVDRAGQLSFVVPLVSSRAGQDHAGRHYVISVTAVDPTSNPPNQTVGTAYTVVTVPHDMGHGARFYGGGPYYGRTGPLLGNSGAGARYEARLLARQEQLAARRDLFANRPFQQFQNNHGGGAPFLRAHQGRGHFKVPPGHRYVVTVVPGNMDFEDGHGHGNGNGNGHGNGNGNGHGNGNDNAQGNENGQGNGHGHGHGHG